MLKPEIQLQAKLCYAKTGNPTESSAMLKLEIQLEAKLCYAKAGNPTES